MSEKTFKRLLYSLLALGVLFSIAHILYAVRAYPNSSIVHFIAKELW